VSIYVLLICVKDEIAAVVKLEAAGARYIIIPNLSAAPQGLRATITKRFGTDWRRRVDQSSASGQHPLVDNISFARWGGKPCSEVLPCWRLASAPTLSSASRPPRKGRRK